MLHVICLDNISVAAQVNSVLSKHFAGNNGQIKLIPLVTVFHARHIMMQMNKIIEDSE